MTTPTLPREIAAVMEEAPYSVRRYSTYFELNGPGLFSTFTCEHTAQAEANRLNQLHRNQRVAALIAELLIEKDTEIQRLTSSAEALLKEKHKEAAEAKKWFDLAQEWKPNAEREKVLMGALSEALDSLNELLDYSGGADHGLDDRYVVSRAEDARDNAFAALKQTGVR